MTGARGSDKGIVFIPPGLAGEYSSLPEGMAHHHLVKGNS